ncbi:TNFAIP3-interacting protein 2 isoform X2 [Betta splendens]|uniref:TNFAIP3-interacting protein 2 n=1 Tax=Betta splendens TaxID=158456 RepID=A0A6P7NII6_BETSP|nr:TNFAIP3-interacting protein 2 isoform X2 [Betta splendens]
MDSVSVNAENDAPKDRTRSYSTLNTLYHETRVEVELLNKEISLKDNIITDLKARLGKHERLCVNVGDNEPVVVGPSKSLLESLCKEICKLKQKRKDMEFKAARQEEEVQRLSVQLRQKDLELESLRCQPEHEKDREVQRLRLALEERERRDATRAVLCGSLAEEADGLRSQLGATARLCHKLLARLETDARGAAPEEAAPQQTPQAEESPDPSGVRGHVRQLQAENKQLKERVAYVQGLNSQWQKYDSSREDYIRGLCHRLKETSGLGSVGAGLLHQEISRLNGLLEDKVGECSRLGREAEEARRRQQERIQTLEQQVLIYAEDFKSERADRERAQGHIDDLKEQVHQLKQQLLKQQGAGREARDLVPVCRVHIGHRISPKRHKEPPEHMLRTNAEAPQPPAPAPAPRSPGTVVATPSLVWECPVSELQCPWCHAKFSESDAVEYMNHCEECAKL